MTTRHLGLTWIGLAFVLLSLSACAPMYAGRQSFLRATGSYAGVTFTFDCRPGDGGRLDIRNDIFFQCESVDRQAILSIAYASGEHASDDTIQVGLSIRTNQNANLSSLGFARDVAKQFSGWTGFASKRLESRFEALWPSGASVKGQFLLMSD